MRPYNSQSKKLDPKTISGYFVGYCVGSKRSGFYYPSHTTRVIESDRPMYFEDDIGTSQGLREVVFKEHIVFILVPIASALISNPVVDQHQIATTDDEPIEDVDPVAPNVDLVAPDVGLVAPDVDLVALDVVMDIPLRRSERELRPVISDNYIFYLQEHECDVGDKHEYE